MSTEDGYPEDVIKRASVFAASTQFESMVRCIASKIAQSAHRKGNANEPNTLNSDERIFLATDAADLRVEFASRLEAAVKKLLSKKYVAVEYFNSSLPPAHFHLWAYRQQKITEVDNFCKFSPQKQFHISCFMLFHR